MCSIKFKKVVPFENLNASVVVVIYLEMVLIWYIKHLTWIQFIYIIKAMYATYTARNINNVQTDNYIITLIIMLVLQ